MKSEVVAFEITFEFRKHMPQLIAELLGRLRGGYVHSHA